MVVLEIKFESKKDLYDAFKIIEIFDIEIIPHHLSLSVVVYHFTAHRKCPIGFRGSWLTIK